MFQSTRPRGARPHELAAVIDKQVSIHAPAGGATRLKTNNDNGGCVSIHAPAGARLLVQNVAKRNRGFNPRARGGRDNFPTIAERGYRVSIHAPAGGAT